MKSKFFEKIELINLYSNSSINKRLQINKTRKELGDIKTDATGTHWVIRHYYEQLYAN